MKTCVKMNVLLNPEHKKYQINIEINSEVSFFSMKITDKSVNDKFLLQLKPSEIYKLFSSVGRVNDIISKECGIWTLIVIAEIPNATQFELQCQNVAKSVDFDINIKEVRAHIFPARRRLFAAEQLPNNIDSLNDDCLREIFESPMLSAKYLVMLASTNNRFHEIAENAFRSSI